jgi:hypothetical protein
MPFAESGKRGEVQDELTRLRELCSMRRLASLKQLLDRRAARRGADGEHQSGNALSPPRQAVSGESIASRRRRYIIPALVVAVAVGIIAAMNSQAHRPQILAAVAEER